MITGTVCDTAEVRNNVIQNDARRNNGMMFKPVAIYRIFSVNPLYKDMKFVTDKNSAFPDKYNMLPWDS